MFRYDFSRLPFVSMTGKVREGRGWSHNGRRMGVNMLVIIHRGSCRFTIGGRDYDFAPGDVALVPKGMFYRPHTDDFCEYTFFHFDGELVPMPPDEKIVPFDAVPVGKPFYGLIRYEEPTLAFDYHIALGAGRQDAELLLRKCADVQRRYAEKMTVILSLHFSELMFRISQCFCEQFRERTPVPAAVAKIVSYIGDHYMQNITLADVCKETELSKQYCMRVFRKHMQTTIGDYILEMRMRHAAYLLRNTYMNVNQAADYLGFSSSSYFSSVFKQYYGVSPSAYFE